MPKLIVFEDQLSIIDLYAAGLSCKQIGKQFGCSKQTINKLLKSNLVDLRDPSHSNRKYKINENIFETISNHETAYWLGMIAGDGWITNRFEFGLSLQEKDMQHMLKYRSFLQCEHPLSKIINRPKKDGSASISYTLTINNKKIVSDLTKYGIVQNKTFGMDFPKLDDAFLPSYMLGLVDSDGCFCLKQHYKKDIKLLNFSFVGPTNFVETFQNILIDKCGISKTKLGTQNTQFIRIVNYSGYKNIFKIVKYLYGGSNVFLDRKKDIAINYLLTKYPNNEWLIEQSKIKSI